MARIINHHSLEATGGKTYSEMGRYLATDGTDTNDPNAAVKGADGKPVASPLRNTAFQASALETSLWSSVLAFNVADLVMGLGVMIIVLGLAVGGVGVALGAMAIPTMAREFHVEPVAATHATTTPLYARLIENESPIRNGVRHEPGAVPRHSVDAECALCKGRELVGRDLAGRPGDDVSGAVHRHHVREPGQAERVRSGGVRRVGQDRAGPVLVGQPGRWWVVGSIGTGAGRDGHELHAGRQRIAPEKARQQRHLALAVRAPMCEEDDELGLSGSGDVDGRAVEARTVQLGDERSDGGVGTIRQHRQRFTVDLDRPRLFDPGRNGVATAA